MNQDHIIKTAIREIKFYCTRKRIMFDPTTTRAILLFIHLYSRGELQFLKITENDICESSKDITVLAYKNLNDSSIDGSLLPTENEDYANGIKYYAFASSATSDNSLFEIIKSTFKDLEKKKDDKWEKPLKFDNLYHIYCILKKIPKEHTNNTQKLIKQFYISTVGVIGCGLAEGWGVDTASLKDNLICFMFMLAKCTKSGDKRIIHYANRVAGLGDYIFKMPIDCFFSITNLTLTNKEEEDLLNTIFLILDIKSNYTILNKDINSILDELENNNTDCIIVDDIDLNNEKQWKIITKTAQRNIPGFFLVKTDNLIYYWDEWENDGTFDPNTGRHILEKYISKLYTYQTT